MSNFELSQELREVFDNLILEWIQLNYHSAKNVQKETSNYNYNYYTYVEQIHRIIFLRNAKEFVQYILGQKKIKNSHKIPMIQFIIHYDKTNMLEFDVHIDSILLWEQFHKLSYLVEHLMYRYIKIDNIRGMILQTFEDLENRMC